MECVMVYSFIFIITLEIEGKSYSQDCNICFMKLKYGYIFFALRKLIQ